MNNGSKYFILISIVCVVSCTYTIPDSRQLGRMRASNDSLMLALITPPHKHQMPISRPDDFVFQFVYSRKNILDLFKNTFTRDMIAAHDTTIPFKLSSIELDSIYSEMRKIDLFNYPALWTDSSKRWYKDRVTYFIRLDSLQRIFTFDLPYDNSINDTTISIRRLNTIIIGIIESSPSFKALPLPEGLYFDK